MNRWPQKIKLVLIDYYRSHLKPAFAKDFDLLIVIVSLALALRLYFALTSKTGPTLGFETDFILASQGSTIDGIQAPFYIHLLRFMPRLGDWPAVYIFQALTGTAGILLLYYVTTRVCNRKAGLLAAALGAISPGAVLLVISTTPAALLVLVSIVLMAALISQGGEYFRAVVAGAAVATGILLDPVMVFLVPGTLAAVKKRFAFAIVLAGLLLPWTLRNSIIEKTLVPVYRIEAYRLDLDKFHPSLLRGGWHFIDSIYNNVSAITGKGTMSESGDDDISTRNSTYTTTYTYAFIMILGLFGLAKRYRKEARPAILPFVSYTFLLIFLTVFSQRYRIVLEPLFMTYAAALFLGSRQSGTTVCRDHFHAA